MDKLKRYELINQLLILEKLYPEEADYYAKNRKALENGYELHYSWLTENISDGLSEEECKCSGTLNLAT
ncbi:YfbU family protein [Arsukibacterium perlucidum]|uniref:YfbU family protein n=1 Tax=Arsukibacterium perlucidum TaxID=368811 RepID=UPI0003818F55|nr:YfbU family protein [Arsukibacterium perlucidum]